MAPAVTFSVLQAPPGWATVDFISDLHLQASEPQTFAAWQRYLQTTRADAIFILGDLFEVWVGDDAASPANPSFEQQCAQVLQDAARLRPLFFMRGNRDFLVGTTLMAQCHTTLLADPTVLVFGGEKWLLTHGDALCLADTDYQAFRAMVRSPAWQQSFLAKPLPERQAMARHLRTQSEAHKSAALVYADVDAEAAASWLTQAQAGHMVHGHTHRPATHALGAGLERIVLSDWDVGASPPRAEVLRLGLPVGRHASGRVTVSRISTAQA